jgi:hypothetical protein
MGGYWLKNRERELFQNRNRDSNAEGFSKLDSVNKVGLHCDVFRKECTK